METIESTESTNNSNTLKNLLIRENSLNNQMGKKQSKLSKNKNSKMFNDEVKNYIEYIEKIVELPNVLKITDRIKKSSKSICILLSFVYDPFIGDDLIIEACREFMKNCGEIKNVLVKKLKTNSLDIINYACYLELKYETKKVLKIKGVQYKNFSFIMFPLKQINRTSTEKFLQGEENCELEKEHSLNVSEMIETAPYIETEQEMYLAIYENLHSFESKTDILKFITARNVYLALSKGPQMAQNTLEYISLLKEEDNRKKTEFVSLSLPPYLSHEKFKNLPEVIALERWIKENDYNNRKDTHYGIILYSDKLDFGLEKVVNSLISSDMILYRQSNLRDISNENILGKKLIHIADLKLNDMSDCELNLIKEIAKGEKIIYTNSQGKLSKLSKLPPLIITTYCDDFLLKCLTDKSFKNVFDIIEIKNEIGLPEMEIKCAKDRITIVSDETLKKLNLRKIIKNE